MNVPEGMVEVSQEEFFRLLYADQRDIMPSHRMRGYTTWEAVYSRAMWGWSYPGWANPGERKAFAVVRGAVKSKDDQTDE